MKKIEKVGVYSRLKNRLYKKNIMLPIVSCLCYISYTPFGYSPFSSWWQISFNNNIRDTYNIHKIYIFNIKELYKKEEKHNQNCIHTSVITNLTDFTKFFGCFQSEMYKDTNKYLQKIKYSWPNLIWLIVKLLVWSSLLTV